MADIILLTALPISCAVDAVRSLKTLPATSTIRVQAIIATMVSFA